MSGFSGEDVAGLIAGTWVEVVGVEPDEHGLRVYLTHRAMGAYAVIADAAAADAVRSAWSGGYRFAIPKPPASCIFYTGEAS